MSPRTPFDAASSALARAARITETQARGTMRLILGARGVVVSLARRGDVLAALDDLAVALKQRHLASDPSVLSAVAAAVATATDPRDDGYDLFHDID